MSQSTHELRLTAEGKYWGTLEMRDGRLYLGCQHRGIRVQFDLLSSIEHGRPVAVRRGEVVVRHVVDEE